MDDFADEFKRLEKSIAKLEEYLLDGESNFTVEIDGANMKEKLYAKYQLLFENYIISTVFPPFYGKHGEFMLREMTTSWSSFKRLVQQLSRFSDIIMDRNHATPSMNLPSVEDVGLICYNQLVYQTLRGRAKDAAICLIDKERKGKQIDRALLKSVVDMFVEVGTYKNDFELYMLANTFDYYSQKAREWILKDSCKVYMAKAVASMKIEKERVKNYLQPSSENKLLKVVEHQLLSAPKSQLLERKHGGVCALLRDGKVDNLSRMFRLFSRVEDGLECVLQLFQKYVIDESNALVKHSGDDKDVLVTKVIELHDKYLAYIIQCFQEHPLFREALKEAFRALCHDLLKEVDNEKLSDEDELRFSSMLKA